MLPATTLPDRGRRRRREIVLEPEVPVEQRRLERQAARLQFRLYCVACGRSETVAHPPSRTGRCTVCGGTLLTELEPSATA